METTTPLPLIRPLNPLPAPLTFARIQALVATLDSARGFAEYDEFQADPFAVPTPIEAARKPRRYFNSFAGLPPDIVYSIIKRLTTGGDIGQLEREVKETARSLEGILLRRVPVDAINQAFESAFQTELQSRFRRGQASFFGLPAGTDDTDRVRYERAVRDRWSMFATPFGGAPSFAHFLIKVGAAPFDSREATSRFQTAVPRWASAEVSKVYSPADALVADEFCDHQNFARFLAEKCGIPLSTSVFATLDQDARKLWERDPSFAAVLGTDEFPSASAASRARNGTSYTKALARFDAQQAPSAVVMDEKQKIAAEIIALMSANRAPRVGVI